MWHDNILGTVGNTPLVRLNRVAAGVPCTVLAKLEYFNPGASVKDRIGIAMVERAEREGLLKPGGTIIEGTSGNTGAGLALAAIARGYRCIFTTTDKQSQEKIDVLQALDAEVIVCPTNVEPDDPRSYYSVARRLAAEIPNSVYLNQYDNPANAEAHYATTGPELWEQTEGRITHYIASAGTGGTISGTARYLKEQNPDISVIGVDPYGSVYYKYFFTREFDKNEIYPYLTEGVGEDILAKNMDFDLIDDYVRVTDKESMQMTRRLAREEGMFVGQSCGMAVAGALQWCQTNRETLSPDDVIVVVLPDSGFRYLSKTYNDKWMRNNGFLERPNHLTVEEVVSLRRRRKSIVQVQAGETLGDAIAVMTEHGISQIPVMEGDKVVGSLTEKGILKRLIEAPAARNERVREAMSDPFPIVPSSLHLEHLSAYLEEDMGAVLVERADGTYDIITKSDLISALANTGRSNQESKGKSNE
ncbi:MAG: cystathionine beta-synthase [Rhodothermales bacterium]